MAPPLRPAAPPPQQHKTDFFDLPRELRDEIYSLALDAGPHNVSHPRYNRPERNFKFPALAQINRQLRQEVSETWYSISTFKFQSSFDIVDLYNLVGGDNIAMVCHFQTQRTRYGQEDDGEYLLSIRKTLQKVGLVVRENAIVIQWRKPVRLDFWV